MSYLAFNAAPIQDDSANDKKRIARNKTIKKHTNNGRVADIISQIHKSSLLNDEENDMGEFNLPYPVSVGSERKAETEMKEENAHPPSASAPSVDKSQGQWQQVQGQGNGLPAWQGTRSAYSPASYIAQASQYPQASQYSQASQYPQQAQQHNGDEPVNIDGFKNLENHSDVGSTPFLHKLPYYNQMSLGSSVSNRDELLNKLNYMIHILEEQQDQKTGHVTEEIILYSFLGIFIIFVIDSFARAGKYVR
jgi:hypothetical protein